MGRSKKADSDSLDSDFRYFSKLKKSLIDSGGDKNTAFAEAFLATVARARAQGAYVFIRKLIRVHHGRLGDEAEGRGGDYARATAAVAAVLRGGAEAERGADVLARIIDGE